PRRDGGHGVAGEPIYHRWYHRWHDHEDDGLPAGRPEGAHHPGSPATRRGRGRGDPEHARRRPAPAEAEGGDHHRPADRRSRRRAPRGLRRAVIIADTSGLLALLSTSEPRHRDAADSVAAETGPLVVSPYVVAELDDLLATRFGVEPELAVLDELASGAYELAS